VAPPKINRHQLPTSVFVDVQNVWVIQPAAKQSIDHVFRSEPGINPFDNWYIKMNDIVADDRVSIGEHLNAPDNWFLITLVIKRVRLVSI